MFLVGSRALALRAPQLLNREPADFDFIGTEDEVDLWVTQNASRIGLAKDYRLGETKRILEGSTICEFEMIYPGLSSEAFAELAAVDADDTPFGKIPSLDMLFTLKASHRYLKNSPHFWKNLMDYHRMKAAGAKVRPEYREFLKQREKETYTYKHPSLNQGKKDFFKDDGIKYVYDHDSIHRAIAIHERPAYTYYMKDGAEVQCDKNKFFALPFEYQIAGTMEEAAVLAIERSLVPHPGVMTPKQAWHYALMKVCTSITSGWFREFSYENAFEAMKRFAQYDFWGKFQAGVESGTVIAL